MKIFIKHGVLLLLFSAIAGFSGRLGTSGNITTTTVTDQKVRNSRIGYTLTDSGTLDFLIPVSANGEAVLEYTVRR